MLAVSDVRLRPDTQGSRGFDHEFAAGDITVVLGANQSGKTDLCRLIMGLNTRASGRVWIDGQEVSGDGPRQRPVSLVYQAFVNYPNLTVAQNIASPLVARRLAQGEVRAAVDTFATRLGIADLLSRYPHELSGGQQQRLAIARALAKGARVLLLDEPLVNLDFKLREALETELRDLLGDGGTIVVYTSSDPGDAFAMGDHVLLLADGDKLQAGVPIEVYRSPENETAMELMADPCINRLQLAGAPAALRPEHVALAEAAAPRQDGDLNFDMQVTACETNGNETFVHGVVEGHAWVIRCDGMWTLHSGERAELVARSVDVVRF
jgi:glycerol transport system ATP-binding protein